MGFMITKLVNGKLKQKVHVFHRLKVDRELAVKEFSRPAAGKGPVNPCDLRPAPVLRKTVNYLLNRQV